MLALEQKDYTPEKAGCQIRKAESHLRCGRFRAWRGGIRGTQYRFRTPVTIAEYRYDGQGRRIAKAVDGTTTHFLYAGYTRDAEESAESLLARGGESYTLTEYISQAGATRGTRMPRFPVRRRPSC